MSRSDQSQATQARTTLRCLKVEKMHVFTDISVPSRYSFLRLSSSISAPFRRVTHASERYGTQQHTNLLLLFHQNRIRTSAALGASGRTIFGACVKFLMVSTALTLPSFRKTSTSRFGVDARAGDSWRGGDDESTTTTEALAFGTPRIVPHERSPRARTIAIASFERDPEAANDPANAPGSEPDNPVS